MTGRPRAASDGELSRRRRVLLLVEGLVARTRTPVRRGDVVAEAAAQPLGRGLAPRDVSIALQSLAWRGELRVVGETRGRDRHLYAPADFAPAAYATPAAPSWLDEVAEVTAACWSSHAAEAAREGRRPTPLATREVREALAARDPEHPGLADPQTLVNAMQQLARGRRAVIRPVVAGRDDRSARLWAPVHVADADLDLSAAHANDAERLEEALRRALARAATGAVRDVPVTARAVAQEIAADPRLALRAAAPVRLQLADLAKDSVDDGDGGRRPRVTRRVLRAGRFGAEAYYALGGDAEGEAAAAGWVAWWNLESDWHDLAVAERQSTVEECELPALRAARVQLLLAETEAALRRCDALLEGPGALGTAHAARPMAELLRTDARELRGQFATWLRLHGPAAPPPAHSGQAAPGWTPDEFRAIAAPLLSATANVDARDAFIRRVYPAVRRVPNPSHTRRWDADPQQAPEFLFDRADCRMRLALRWGGPFTLSRAMLARPLLDRVRDPDVLLRDLAQRAPASRIAALSCLAFLDPTDEAVTTVRRLLEGDANSAVRRIALWVYAFWLGPGAWSVVQARAKNGPDGHERQQAGQMLRILDAAGPRMQWGL